MCELPVGGGAGVQDVLFGSEQRQIVGIKVDLSCVHDGKSFQTSAVWLSSLVPTVSGGGCWWVGSSAEEKKKKTATAECRFTAEQQRRFAGSCREVGWGRFKFRSGGAKCTGAAYSQRGGGCDCTRRLGAAE